MVDCCVSGGESAGKLHTVRPDEQLTRRLDEWRAVCKKGVRTQLLFGINQIDVSQAPQAQAIK
jgi:hypothetical protein